MRIVTFKIEEDLLEELDRYASMTGESRSEVIRKALRYLIARELGKKERVKVRVYA